MNTLAYFLIPATILSFIIAFYFAIKSLSKKLNSDLALSKDGKKREIQIPEVEYDKITEEINSLKSQVKLLTELAENRQIKTSEIKHQIQAQFLWRLLRIYSAHKRDYLGLDIYKGMASPTRHPLQIDYYGRSIQTHNLEKKSIEFSNN